MAKVRTNENTATTRNTGASRLYLPTNCFRNMGSHSRPYYSLKMHDYRRKMPPPESEKYKAGRRLQNYLADTVYISVRKPARIAGMVSPIEAIRYMENDRFVIPSVLSCP